MVQKLTLYRKEEVRTAIAGLIAGVKQECALPEEKEFCIKLVLSELMLNALENHPKTEDPAVDIWFKMDPAMNVCKILVAGKGPGFDAAAFLRQMEHKPCETTAESGRGLMLVKAHSHTLKFNKKGNKAFVMLK